MTPNYQCSSQIQLIYLAAFLMEPRRKAKRESKVRSTDTSHDNNSVCLQIVFRLFFPLFG